MTSSEPKASSELADRLAQLPNCAVGRREALAPHTTLRIGGPAEILARIGSEEALIEVLRLCRRFAAPFRILGLGSNVLVPDEGISGVVALLEGEFLECEIHGETVVAGAAVPLARAAQRAVKEGLAGLEALAGFPSTVGGAVVMNAGCYGVEIKDLLDKATVIHLDGSRRIMTATDLHAGYRSTCLQESRAVVVRASFSLQRDPTSAAADRLQELNRKRRASMPSGRPNAGSIFKNPPGDYAGRLIELCGLKGTRRGGAEISVEHANVIVNTGGARAVDVLELMAMMYQRVLTEHGVVLQPELILLAQLASRWKSMSREVPA